MSDSVSLGDFVAEALVEIARGVSDASAKVEALGGAVNPNQWRGEEVKTDPHLVSFDVAVFAEASASSDRGGQISVAGFSLSVDGNESAQRQQRESRISFKIPIKLPVGRNTDVVNDISSGQLIESDYNPFAE